MLDGNLTRNESKKKTFIKKKKAITLKKKIEKAVEHDLHFVDRVLVLIIVLSLLDPSS